MSKIPPEKWMNDPGPLPEDLSLTDADFARMARRGVKPEDLRDPSESKAFAAWLASQKPA